MVMSLHLAAAVTNCFSRHYQKNENPSRHLPEGVFRALLGTRTLDPLIKSQLLYQLS